MWRRRRLVTRAEGSGAGAPVVLVVTPPAATDH